MPRAPFRLPLLAVLVFAAIWWVQVQRHRSSNPVTSAPAAPGAPTATPPASTPPVAPILADAAPVDAASAPSGGVQRAFRFVLNAQKLDLEATEDIRGDFHRRRGEMPWAAGMLYYRLLDAQQRVLAEETQLPPDHVCVVLDPHTPDENGRPIPARMTPTGPVVFQARLPKLDDATHLQVYRLTGSRPANAAEPPGQLLAVFPLAK